MTIPTQRNSSRKLSPFISRNFALLWLAQALSSFGEFTLASTVIVWFVTDVAKSSSYLPTLLAGVILTTTLPRLFIAPFAGVLVDKWRAKRTMVVADIVRAAFFIPLLWIVSISGNKMTIIAGVLAVLFLVAFVSQFFNPARAAIMQVVIPSERRREGSSKSTFAVLGVAVLATMLGPGLFALVGPVPSLLINMGTFLSSSFLIILTRNIPVSIEIKSDAASYWKEFRAGIVTAWRIRSIRIVLIGVAFYGLSLGVNSSVLSLFALRTLGLSAGQYGIVSGAFAFGGLVGSIFASRLLQRIGNERAFAGAIVLMGLSYMGYSFTRLFFEAVVVMFVAGLAFSAYVVAQGPILQDATPIGFMGRVTSVSTPVLAVSSLVATVVSSQVLSTASSIAAKQGSVLDPTYYAVSIFIASCLLTGGGLTMLAGQRRVAAPC